MDYSLKNNKLKYIVVVPAYNEEEQLSTLLRSIVSQSHLPEELIIVDDGSEDGTSRLVKEWQKGYDWIQLVKNSQKEPYASGSKVVRAFYLGYKNVEKPFDILVKLDADLELPGHYFETICDHFSKDVTIGIAGGVIMTMKSGIWVPEMFSDKDHVKGAYKAYRRQCFEDIGGLKESIGWDTVDELLAMYHGWKIYVDQTLEVRHHRPLGTKTGKLKIRTKIGNGLYRMRYGFVISLISSIKAGYLNKPYIFTGIWQIGGWITSWLKREKFIVTKEEGAFIRQYRRRRMLEKIKF